MKNINLEKTILAVYILPLPGFRSWEDFQP